jgi:hypothetical protein
MLKMGLHLSSRKRKKNEWQNHGRMGEEPNSRWEGTLCEERVTYAHCDDDLKEGGASLTSPCWTSADDGQ